jgi:3-hydroxybutyryl-CoA dehydrogenase
MKVEDVKLVAVIGAGAMGAQIAQLLSQVAGIPSTITDMNQEAVDRGLAFIKNGLQKFFVDKGKMSQGDMDQIVGRIKGVPNQTEAVKGADLVIEAVYENMDIKKRVFAQLDKDTPKDMVLASNSSSLNISEIACATSKPEKVVGMHFFNPVAVMKLVEVVKGPLTEDGAVQLIYDLSKKLNKEPVVCKDFSYGFLANRAYNAMVEEATQMLWERVATPEEIDKALRLGYNFPMGPLELSDYTGGWALHAASEEARMKEMGPEKGHLHPLVRMMIRAGYTGGQGKKGVYHFYNDVMSKW